MFNVVADFSTILCILLMLGAVLFNFINIGENRSFRERRSPIATASMTAFFILLYLTIRFQWSANSMDGLLPLRWLGLTGMVFGAIFNLWGRVYLKTNWANQVRIYDDQQLITTGPYRIVRHPLYASIIWMFYGASLVYLNPLAALEITLLFIPAMLYRSNLEELALTETFGEKYIIYKTDTGRFFPKIKKQKK